MEGWIKLHRSFLDHWLCDEYRPLTKREAWETILFTVNYEDKKVLIKGQLYDCLRGQSLLSLQSWANKFVWSLQNVRSFFKLLESDNMIIVEGLQYSTRLTVCNYDKYQDNQQANNTPLTGEQHAANTPLTDEQQQLKNTKNPKKVKKEKNIVYPTIEEVRLYFTENGYTEQSSIKFFKYYSVAEWKDSKGNIVKNWKQKAQSVWFKDENKEQSKQNLSTHYYLAELKEEYR
jgi:hypothetical protein